MSHRVVWDDRALSELSQIRRTHADKEGFEHVVARLDTQLTHRPQEAGESREFNYRVVFKYPLIVWFEVLDESQEVRIVHVRRSRR